MMAWIDGLPLLWSIGFFWMLAILRTLIVFSLGRGWPPALSGPDGSPA